MKLARDFYARPCLEVAEALIGKHLVHLVHRGNRRTLAGRIVETEAYVHEEDRAGPRPRIAQTPRIGVDYAGEWAQRPWRFVDADSPWLSRKLPGTRSTVRGKR